MPQMNSDDSSSGSWSEKGLWDQIRGYLKSAEVDEVRRAIGETIIQRNEDLHREIEALATIVDEFRDQNFSYMEERRRKAQFRRESSLGLSGGTERKLLEQQIRMLLHHDKSSRSRPQAVVVEAAVKNGSDAKVLEYITSSSDGSLRLDVSHPDHLVGGSLPSSARPMSALSTNRSARGARSARSLPADVFLGAAVDDNGGCRTGTSIASRLNVSDISSVVAGLRNAFAEEEARLQEDVESLMAAFEGEDLQRQQVEAECKASEDSVPSTKELREFSRKLQQETERAPVTTHLLTTNGRFGFTSSSSSSSSSSPPSALESPACPSPHRGSSSGGLQRSLPALAPLAPAVPDARSAPHAVVPPLNLAPPRSRSDSERKKADYLRRPPLPTAPSHASLVPGVPPCTETTTPSSSSTSSFSTHSSRFKSAVADAALTARDDFHLNSDEDERFWS